MDKKYSIPIHSSVRMLQSIPDFLNHYRTILLQSSSGSDKAVRMEILAYAILQGVITGYVIDSIYLSYIPFAIVTPAIVALSFAV